MTGIGFLRDIVGAEQFRQIYTKTNGNDFSWVSDEAMINLLRPVAAFKDAKLTIDIIKEYRHEIGLQKRNLEPELPELTIETAPEPFTNRQLLTCILGVLVEMRDTMNEYWGMHTK